MAILSQSQPTPEAERFLLFRMPQARGEAYIHAIALANGAEVQWKQAGPSIQRKTAVAWLAVTNRIRHDKATPCAEPSPSTAERGRPPSDATATSST